MNIFGGPGSGKSTIAADLFSKLKREGLNVELVTEYAKDLTWESRDVALSNQVYILGKQFHRLHRIQEHVDIAITDSPILLAAVYAKGQWGPLESMALFLDRKFRNINVVLDRDKSHYSIVGRKQSLEEAILSDQDISWFLELHRITYYTIPAGIETASRIKEILDDIHQENRKGSG